MIDRPLRIALVAPPLETVPPTAYGGTERVVAELVRELVWRGHRVTTFASGDSVVPGELVPTVPAALRPAGFNGDPVPFFERTVQTVLAREADFDLIHAHLDAWNLDLMDRATVPVVATFHLRLDQAWAAEAFRDPRPGLVAISADQARLHPAAGWTVIHHGLTFVPQTDVEPGDDLCFVGRMSPEKGIVDAIEVARLTGRRLRIAVKRSTDPDEVAYRDAVFLPAARRADVEVLGELTTTERDRLLAESRAAVMPSAWPEPFGLVAIEALACGTPLLGRRAGALPELIRDGVDGFLGDDARQLAFLDGRVPTLDRAAIRSAALDRFSAARMVDRYLETYVREVERHAFATGSRAAIGARAVAPRPARSGSSGPAVVGGTAGRAASSARGPFDGPPGQPA